MQQPVKDNSHAARHYEFKTFVARNVAPCAEQWDREQRIPDSAIAQLARSGYLGCLLPGDVGGQGWDVVDLRALERGVRAEGPPP